jgi:3-dehydroquinate synthetase
LALADTSVGGKSGLDLPQGKNLIGVMKQPSAIIADVATLQTLPREEFVSGMAEVIKHGLLADTDLLQKVERGTWRFEAGAPPFQLSELQTLVAQSMQVKIAIVQIDPDEHGRRTTLNLGHTFAHAIEQVSGYTIRHGEAVAMGLVAAANLSVRLGHCLQGLEERIISVLDHVGLPTSISPDLSPQALFEAMGNDKKRVGGQLRFVLLRDIGDAFVANDVPTSAVLETLKEVSSRHLN